MIVSICKSGRIDPVWHNLFKEVETDIPIVIVTRLEGYEFNDELLKLDKYILVCGCEYDWDEKFEHGTHLFGINTIDYKDKFKGAEWDKFDEFVTNNIPTIYFKRELLGNTQSNYVFPINYPCWYEIPEVQTKEQFNARPLLWNFIWGLSHEYRKHLHGEIWQRGGEFGYVTCDNVTNLPLFLEKEDNPKKVLTANVAWYVRHDMSTITAINQISKVSISLHGSGRHCFRMSESPMASVMYMWDSGIKYSYDWIHNVNCIMSEQGKELQTIMEAINNPRLYEIYLAGVENCKKYYLPTYVKNYIQPLIQGL